MKSPPILGRQTQDLLCIIYRFSKEKKAKLYIVGGILRDILLKRVKDNLDIDFCLKKDAINFGRKLAAEIKAGFVVLDKEHGACRLVKKVKDTNYTLDFTDFRGIDLDDDLLHRDFTINTLAVELDRLITRDKLSDILIDRYGAINDLHLGIIRAVNQTTFDEDPLRILRAFAFASIFGFKIDKETLRLIKSKKNKLSGVSYERIRDELFKILDTSCAVRYLTQMDNLGILKIIIPEIKLMYGVNQGPYHHLDVWKHTLETIRQLEGLVQEHKNKLEIRDYLKEVISPGRKRLALIKFGALLHDIGKPGTLRHEDGKIKFHGHERKGLGITEIVVKRLKLSNDELDSLKKMILWHLRPGYLADVENITARARFRYFRDAANEAASILLLSIADQRATKGRLTSWEFRKRHEKVAFGLLREYFKKKKEKKLPRLLNGDELIRRFNLKPSPLIGKILSELAELQAIGEIKRKKEALEVARGIIKKDKK
jgi:poly(A) polymerase